MANGWVVQAAAPGPYDLSRTPWARGVLDAFDDPRVSQLTIMKGSQTGATELSIQILGYVIDRRPRTTMIVYPTADTAAEMNRDRITPSLAKMPPIRDARLKETRKDGSARVVRYKTMPVFFRGAGTERQMESLPAGLVINDEVDRCPPGTVHLLRQRGKTYPDFKLIALGKPGYEGQGIDVEWWASSRNDYHVPCPFCYGSFARVFSRVRWFGMQRDGKLGPDSRDVNVDETQAHDTAVYKCPHCHVLIGPEHNHWQLNMGVWVPAGAKAVGATKDTPARIEWPDGEPHFNSNQGFHIPHFLTGLEPNPYAASAHAFVRINGRRDEHFVRDYEGRPWRLTLGNRAETTELKKRIDPTHRLGRVPNEVIRLVAAADLQHHDAYMVVWGFSAKMERAWLIWHERVACPVGDRLSALGVVMARRFRRDDGKDMVCVAKGVDSGEGVRTKEVYEFCAVSGVTATKGVGVDRSGQNMDESWKIKEINAIEQGLGGKNVKLLRMKSHVWKQTVQRALGMADPDAGQPILADDDAEVVKEDETRTTDATAHSVVLPADVPEYVLQHLASEECVKVENSKRGGLVVEYQWRLREGMPHNHYFDATYAAFCLADAHGWRQATTPKGIIGGAVGGGVTSDPVRQRQARTGPSMVGIARERSIVDKRR
jgi:phage terminase large subunit GpA-like protein